MRINFLLLVILVFLVFNTSCKKEKEEGPESLEGTVWLSARIDNKQEELRFLTEEKMTRYVSSFNPKPDMVGIRPEDTLTFYMDCNYDYYYPHVKLKMYYEVNLVLQGDKLFSTEFTYYKQ